MKDLKSPARFFCLPVAMAICAHPGFAQIYANVTVDASKPVNTLTRASIGVDTQMSDGNWMNAQVAPLLRVAGIGAVRYPDGYDGQADLYHWPVNKAIKWGNSDPPKVAYYPAGSDFGHFALFLDQLGTAMITVNYGSNMAGTGGGEPQEAAAWVAYANGDPANAAVIGKDSTGYDWKTAGFWAAMRASPPLNPDDGFNFLRIAHPKPLNLKLWEIGNEVYNNGWFGGEHISETDLHAPYPANQKENEKRRKNPNLSPAYYGSRLTEFAKAMKAVDPAILIGASLNTPPNDYGWGEGWDDGVLKAACQDIDFVSLHWHPGGVLPPDWKILDEASALSAPEDQLPKTVTELLYLYKKDCPATHLPRVAYTEVSPISWGKLQTPVVNALFAADAYALLAEMGTVNTDWYQLHENSLLTDENKPLPAYYGLQMLHIVAFQPGDSFLSAVSNKSALSAYATQRHDGVYGLIFINKDPKSSAEVKVTMNGAQAGTKGMRFDYGPEQTKANAAMVRTPLTGLGNSFTVTVPAYSIVDILVEKAP